MAMTLPSAKDKRQAVERMFDRIAPSYDRMNALLSMGAHRRWKRLAIEAAEVHADSLVVDLACGTGDLACEALARNAEVIGVDVSESMLERARQRAPRARFLRAEAENLPLADGSVDALVCGFALRNFVSIERVLEECARVLKGGGHLAIVEVDVPRTAFLRTLHSVYFNRVVPFVGGVLADSDAYAYLPESVAYLPDEVELQAMLERAGFTGVSKRRLLAGAAQLLVAERSRESAAARRNSGAGKRCVPHRGGTR